MRLLFLILFVGGGVSAQKLGIPTPPNGVLLRDNLFVDSTEVANIHWLEYQVYTQDSSINFRNSIKIDSTVWMGILPNNELISHGHYKHPNYRYYPVVGITQKQALDYCRWRSNAVTRMYRERIEDGHPLFEKYKGYRIDVTYRLLTEEEWEEAARGKLGAQSFPYGYKVLYEKPTPSIITNLKQLLILLDTAVSKVQLKRDIKSHIKDDLKVKFTCHQPQPYFMVLEDLLPKPIRSGERNSIGLYNIIGNVAEMVQEEGVAKGGSWVHELEDCNIENRQYYTRSTSWLGFRCVAEVKLIRLEER